MEARKFPILPQLIGLVCVALGVLGLAGDVYTFTHPAMLATAPLWVHTGTVIIDLLFLAGGVGIIMRKKRLYLLAMGSCLTSGVHTVASWSFLHWDELITASGHQLPEQAISAAVFIAKLMAILMGVLLPAAFLVVLGLYYRRINPDTWR